MRRPFVMHGQGQSQDSKHLGVVTAYTPTLFVHPSR